jgi:sarcosine oxidase subunit beta
MQSADVIIVGGGVIGLSTAFHLAKKRAGRIVLIDKGPIGDGSSSRAAGISSGLLWSPTGVEARKISASLFRLLSEELDGYIYHNEEGCLNLFTPGQWSDAQTMLPMYDRHGVDYEQLSAEKVHARWPSLTPEADAVGLLDPHGGYSEPTEYLSALERRVRELGVEVRQREAVSGFHVHQGRLRGVSTARGEYAADAVVCTVHAWATALLEQVDYKIPVKYFVHQRYVTAPLSQRPAFPPVNANGVDGYVRPAAGNRILIGTSTPDRPEYRVASPNFHMSELSTPTAVRDAAAQKLSALVPALAEVSWESAHVGLLAFSMDQEPILGAVDRMPGLFVGASFHSGGFSYNPVAGQLLAECIVDGSTSIDVTSFSPNRFDPVAVQAYLARSVRQRDMERRRH